MAPTSNRPPEVAHAPFLLAALAFGTLGGFTLAVSLPIEAATGRMDLGWLTHAQMHGHLQAVGFAGLFVIGVALHLAPRFGSRPAAWPGSVPLALLLLVAGLLLRAIGQPLAAHRTFAVAMAGGAWLELAGALLVALVIARTLWPALSSRAPHAWLLACAAGWLVVQGALGAWWVTDLATEGGTILVSTRNSVLIDLQLYGFLLSAILGVGLRTFPTFFGMPPTPLRMGFLVYALLQGGLLVWAVGGIGRIDAAQQAGQASVGLAVLAAVATFGFWRSKHRLAAASRGYIFALQPALLWLTVTGAGLAAGGLRALVSGDAPSSTEADAIRHVFAVGVVTLAIVGMAQLILPEFASERLVAKPSKWRGPAFGVTLSIAVVLRGLVPWAGVAAPERFWLMAVAGLLGLGAIAAFTFLYVRAHRRHRAYLSRITALRAREAEVPVIET